MSLCGKQRKKTIKITNKSNNNKNSCCCACTSLAMLLLEILSFACIVAEKPGSEVTTGIWLSTGGGWILLSASIMKLYFRTIRCFLGFLSLFRVSLLLPSLPPRIVPAQIRVHWEYGVHTFYLLFFFSLIQSKEVTKLFSSLFLVALVNNGPRLNLHCDSMPMALVSRPCGWNKQESKKKTTLWQLNTRMHTRRCRSDTNTAVRACRKTHGQTINSLRSMATWDLLFVAVHRWERGDHRLK